MADAPVFPFKSHRGSASVWVEELAVFYPGGREVWADPLPAFAGILLQTFQVNIKTPENATSAPELLSISTRGCERSSSGGFT